MSRGVTHCGRRCLPFDNRRSQGSTAAHPVALLLTERDPRLLERRRLQRRGIHRLEQILAAVDVVGGGGCDRIPLDGHRRFAEPRANSCRRRCQRHERQRQEVETPPVRPLRVTPRTTYKRRVYGTVTGLGGAATTAGAGAASEPRPERWLPVESPAAARRLVPFERVRQSWPPAVVL